MLSLAPALALLLSAANPESLCDQIRTPTQPAAGELTRGEEVHATPGSAGRPRLYEYTNSGVESQYQYNACGQAAVSTVLTALGIKPEDPTDAVMKEVYKRFPPDILFGKFGTSWMRFQKALKGYGASYRWLEGEQSLRSVIASGGLAVVMLDVGATQDEGWGSIGAHWTVIYAYDTDGVFLSNWPRDGKCTWANLRRGWDTQLTRAFYGAPPWQSHQWIVVPGR